MYNNRPAQGKHDLSLYKWEKGGSEMFSDLPQVIQPERDRASLLIPQSTFHPHHGVKTDSKNPQDVPWAPPRDLTWCLSVLGIFMIA